MWGIAIEKKKYGFVHYYSATNAFIVRQHNHLTGQIHWRKDWKTPELMWMWWQIGKSLLLPLKLYSTNIPRNFLKMCQEKFNKLVLRRKSLKRSTLQMELSCNSVFKLTLRVLEWCSIYFPHRWFIFTIKHFKSHLLQWFWHSWTQDKTFIFTSTTGRYSYHSCHNLSINSDSTPHFTVCTLFQLSCSIKTE